jgi:predicted aspartyl protease
MRIKRFAGFVRLVSLMVCVTSLPGWVSAIHGAVSNPQAAHVPFELDVTGLVLVPVALGGLQVGPCVLDTGASRTMVSDRVKARLGLVAIAQTDVVSAAGVATHEVVRLPPVTIGEVTHVGLMAAVLPSGRMRAIADAAACVIGYDFLAAQDYTIDYTRRTLTWRDVSDLADPTSTRIPLVKAEGRYVAELTQSEPRTILRLVPDTGASDIVIFRQPDLPLAFTPLPGASFGRLAAATGNRSVAAVCLERLRVGSIELKDRPAYLLDRASLSSRVNDEQTGAQGLLPLHLFARVSFNAADRTMIVTPR